MKKSYKFPVYLLYCFLSITYLNASDLYWVGGSGNWNDPSHWSTTSGGLGGLQIPDSTSSIIIDDNSASQDFTININTDASLLNFEMKSIHLVSLKGNASKSISIYGSISWNDRLNNEFQGEIVSYSWTGQNKLVDFSNKLIHGKLSLLGGGTWTVLNSFWCMDSVHLESGSLLVMNAFVVANEFSVSSSNSQSFELVNSQFFVDDPNSGPSSSISFKSDKNSFTNYFSINSKIKSGPNAKAITGFVVNQEDVSCFGFNDGKAWIDTILYTGTSGPYSYLWKRFSNNNTVSTSDTAINLEGGLYSIRITDLSNNSFSQQFVTIDEPSEIGTLIFATDETCRGDCDGSIMVATTGGTTPYTYLWSNNQTNSTATNLCDGQYELTITDANGCIRLDTAIVEEPPLIQPNVSTTDVDCFGNCNGTASSSATGGTGTYIMYEWSTGQSGINLTSINGLCAGNYSVTVTDSDTCSNVENFVISEPLAPLSANLNVTDAACFGQASGSIIVAPAGGTSPYTYLWSDANTSQNRTNVAAGTYMLTVTDVNLCTYLDTAIVGQPSKIAISFSSIVDVFCNGDSTGSAQASPSGGTPPYINYQWSNGDIGPTAIKLPAGFHTVTVTDNAGCTGVDSVEIKQPTKVAVSIDLQQNPLCNGSSDGLINTTPSGGISPYSYAWSDGPSTAEDRTSMPAGAYTFTVTDANGCSLVENVSLSNPPLLTVIIDSMEAVSCNAGSDGFARALGSGGTGALSYMWSNAVSGRNNPNLTAGSYTVTVTDANNCTATAIANIQQPASALSASATKTDASCQGVNDGTATATGSGGTSPYTYNWTGGASTKTISGLSIGSYTVTITDNNGCTDQATVVINQPAAVSVSIVSKNLKCNNDNSGTAEANPSGGTSPYTYLWSDNQSSKKAINLSAGSYSVTVTDANGCTGNASIGISEPTAISASINSHTEPSCNGGNDGTATVSASGGIAPYSYQWNDASNQTTQTASGLSAGSYTVTVTDDSLCTSTASIVISQPAAIGIVDTIFPVSCSGNSDGSIHLFVNGGTSPYTYSWLSGHSGSSIVNLAAGTYKVTITDANLCEDTASFVVSEPNSLNLSFNITNVSCPGNNDGSVTANPSGGTSPYTYLWSNNATSQSISNLSAGVYKVTLTDANSCSIVDSAIVTEPTAITTTMSSTDVSCYGLSDGSASVSASGGSGSYSYLWVNNSATTSSISNLSAGIYVVIVTDTKGCSKTDTVVVNQPDSININLNNQDNISCKGLADGGINISVSGGISPYTYLWSNNATTANISNLSAGSYTLTVTDANSCTNSRSFNITEPQALAISLDSLRNVSCNAANDGLIHISPSGGVSPYTYSWSNLSTAQDQNNLTAGIYSITLTDANSCTFDTSFTISEPTALSLVFSPINVDCKGNNTGSISTSVSGGISPYTYSWSNAATTAGISNLSAGTYSLTLTDANNCSMVDSVKITEPSDFSFIDSVSNNLCFGDCNGTIGIYSFSGGLSPYTFNWSSNVSNSNSGSTYTEAFTLCNGNYSLTISDANGCDTVLNFSITSPTAITASLNSTLSHCAIDDGTATATPSGGVSPYSYNWLGLGQNTQTATGLDAGSYQVEITDANSCRDTFNVNVADTAGPSVNLSAVDVSCFAAKDGMAIASSSCLSSGTCSIEWLYANGSSTNIFNDTLIDSAGTYISKVTFNGCTSFDTISIQSPLALAVNASIQDQSCGSICDGFIKLIASGGTAPYSYNWSPSTVAGQGTDSIFNLCIGNYSVTITDANGCTLDTTFNIVQPNNLSISFNQTNVDCNNASTGSASATVSGGTAPYTYNWSNAATGPNISNLAAGMYILTVTDNNNCSKIDTLNISEPSAFSFMDSIMHNSCFGDCSGNIEVFGFSGGVAPYLFTWSANVSQFTSGTNSSMALSLCAGNYSLTISDANGCDTLLNYQITAPTALVGSTSSTFSHCNVDDGTATVSVSGGLPPYTFNWLGISQSTQTATALDAGIYFVEVSDANFCRDTFSVAVNDSAGPQISLSAQDASCHNSKDGFAIANSLCLMAGTCTIEWFYLNGTSTNVFNDTLVDSAGTYISKVDFSGCVSFDTISIGSPLALTASLNIIDQNCGSSCNGSVKANTVGGTAPYTYAWSPSSVSGQGTDSIFALCKGNYSLTITDANNCEFISNFVVDSSSFSVDLNKMDVSCNGANDGSITSNISGGFAPYTFNWSGGLSGENPVNVSPGIYLLTVTDNTGCTAMDTIEVIQPDSIKANLSLTNTSSCNFNDGAASINPTGGTAPYTYEWFDRFFNPIGETGSSVNSLFNLNYYVVITDANSCVDTVFAPIGTDSNGPALNYTSSDEKCTGSCDGSIDIPNPCLNCEYYLYDMSGQLLSNKGPVAPNTPINFTSMCNGSYILRVVDNNNFACSSIDTVLIGSGASLTLSLTATDALCNGTSTGIISSSLTGGTAPYSFSWSVGLSGANPTNVAAGNYSVTVTDDAGCIATASVQVNEPAAISYSSTTTNSSCNSSDGTATVFPSGGSGNIQVEWLDNNKNPIGQNTATANNLSAGIYYAALMDDNSCVDTVTLLVNDANGPDANIFFSNESCANSCDGSVNVIGDCITDGTCTVVWTNSTGQVIGTSDSIPNLCAGDYFATITDTAGCISILRTSVGAALPITATLGSTNTSCSMATICIGTLYASASGGTGSLTYTWFDSGNNLVGVGDTVKNLCDAGIYFLEVSDQNGCSETFSVAVSDDNNDSISVNTTDVSCGGSCDGSANVNIICLDPACVTRWYDANGLAIDSIKTSISGLCAGDYFVEVTNALDCKSLQKFSISGSDVIQINSSITDVECNSLSSGSINLAVTGGVGGYSYIWSPSPGSGQGTNSISGLSAGTYYVSVSDNNNCMSVDSFEVMEPSAISVRYLMNDVYCGDSTGIITSIVTGGTPPYSYQWFDASYVLLLGETNSVLKNISSGTYRLRIIDSKSCERFFTAVQDDLDGPIIDTAEVGGIECFGGNTGEINLDVSGSGPFKYSWLPYGQTSKDIKNLTAGTYTVIIEDQNGCTGAETYSVGQSDELTASFTLSESECGKCNGEAVISVKGGWPPFAKYTYLWSNGSTSDTAKNLCSGIYTVEVTDGVSCSKTFNIRINNSDGISGANISATSSCFNSCNGTVNVTPIGGTAPYTYLWMHNSSTQSSLSNLCPGSYFVQITDANTCNRIEEVIIGSPSAGLSIEESVTLVSCSGSTCDGSIFVQVKGGMPPYTYAWQPGSFTDTNFISGLCQGNYYLTVSDANSCTVMKSIYLNSEGNFPEPNVRAENESCFNACDGALLSDMNSTILYSYQWLNDAGTAIAPVNTNINSGLCAGIYTLEITELASGCQNFYQVEVEAADSILILPSVIRPISCASSCDAIVNLSAIDGELLYSYSWNDPNAQNSNPAVGLCAGSYTVTVTDEYSCTAVTTVNITSPDLLQVDIDNFSGVNCSGDCNGTANSSAIGGTPPYTFSWDGGQNTQNPIDLCYGMNILTVTDARACTAKDTVYIPAVDTVDVQVNADQIICEADSLILSGTVKGTNNIEYAWYEMPAKVFFTDKLDTSFSRSTGNYEFILVATNGNCSDTGKVEVRVNESPVIDAGNTITLYEDEVERINLSGADVSYTYVWTPAEGLSDSSIANPIASTRETTMYLITVSTVDGCIARDSVLVIYNPDLAIPSGFTPNGDGVNDVWEIDIIAEKFPNAELTIFNRWGEELFRSVGYGKAWDGTYKGSNLPVGTYYFVLDLKDKAYENITGPITIMR